LFQVSCRLEFRTLADRLEIQGSAAKLFEVSPARSAASRRSRSAPPSAPQARVIAAALHLFARHGVGGTSLQMIADEIGVTKAAVYYQYNTKDEIIRAVADAELSRLEAALDAAESEPSPDRARDAVIAGIVDLAVERRHEVSTLLNDPIIGRLYARNKRLLQDMARLDRLLTGANAGPDSQVATAMLTAAISGAVVHPLVVERDDETLRTQLRHLARRFLDLPT
jgi:AcrR family transcriptional regulator